MNKPKLYSALFSFLLVSMIIIFANEISEGNTKDLTEDILINRPKSSDSDYLLHDDFATEGGWAEDYINWGFSTNPSQTIECWALDDTEYWDWYFGSQASGEHLSSASIDSGTFFLPYGDIWHIIFWNNHTSSSSTSVTYGASFYGDTRPHDISIIRPYSGLTLNAGSGDTLQWTSEGTFSNVKVELFKGGTFVSLVYSSTSNDGAEAWTVPMNSEPSTDYRIKITDMSDTSVYDFSDYFMVSVVDSITILAPNNNTILYTEGSFVIKWQSTGDIPFVDIALYDEGGGLASVVRERLPNTGELEWTVPYYDHYDGGHPLWESSNYKLKIEHYSNPTIFAYSENFTIIPREDDIRDPPLISGFEPYMLTIIICIISLAYYKKKL